MNGKRIGVQAFFAIMRILQLTGLQLSGVYCICKKQTIGRYFSSDSTRSEETGGMFFLYKLRLIRIN